MRRLIALGALFAVCWLPAAARGENVTLPHCLVSLIYEAKVPAEEAGVLVEMLVREGAQVGDNDLLARIDDTKTRMEVDVAGYKLEVAKEEAANDVQVRYATAAAKVAEAEYLVNEEANRKVPGTVPQVEIRRLLLTHQRSTLEIEQAQMKFRIAQKELAVSQAEFAASKENLDRRLIKAPVMSPPRTDAAGNPVAAPGDEKVKAEVVELFRHAGEWVQPGDPVLHLVRMDRLRIEGFLNAGATSPGDVINQPVTIRVNFAGGRPEQFQGHVVFVSPVVQAGGDYQVWAEVDNRREPRSGLWLLRPGLPAEMAIQAKK